MRRLIILPVLLFSFTTFSQSAREIIDRADQLMQGNSNKATMTMKIIRPGWSREITMKSWAKGTEYSLILIMAPARDKGTGFLKREKELWNWQPKIDRVVKLPPSMMMQSWMGSDFTNDDLVKESSIVEDYTHELGKDTTVIGYDCWKVILTPKEEAAVVWGRIDAYISKEEYYQLLIKYYDEDGYLVNTMKLSDIRQMGDRKIPTYLEMIPADDPDQKTVIIYEDIEFNVDIPKNFFSIQNLKTIR